MTWEFAKIIRDVDGTGHLVHFKRQLKTRTRVKPQNIRAVKPKEEA